MLPLGMSDSRRQKYRRFFRAQAETYDWDHCCFEVGLGEEEQSVGERKRGCDDTGHLDPWISICQRPFIEFVLILYALSKAYSIHILVRLDLLLGEIQCPYRGIEAPAYSTLLAP